MLVFLVMFLFLQNLRATLIPTIAVPVVLLGTFGVLAALGFSINTLTMFGMVLAIGLLVDDAIVVVENVERVMSEEGLSPREATRKSMDQITGALIGIALVLVGGVRADGVLRRLDRRHLPAVLDHDRLGDGAVGARRADPHAGAVRDDAEAAAASASTTSTHAASSAGSTARSSASTRRLPAAASRCDACAGRALHARDLRRRDRGAMALLFMRLPTAFLPRRGPGHRATARCRRRPGATQERTLRSRSTRSQHYFLNDEKDTVDGVFTVAGFSFAGAGQNSGIAFVKLKDWDERNGKANSVRRDREPRDGHASCDRATRMVFALAPPADPGARQSRRASTSSSRTAAA